MGNPAGQAGFFGGLIEGLGGAFVEKKKQQHKEEQEGLKRRFDAGMLLFDKGFEDLGADLLGSTISGMFGAAPDGKAGKGKPKDGILGVLQNPQAISGLLKGLHGGLTKHAGGATPDQTLSVDQVEGRAPVSVGSGQSEGVRSRFRSREEGEQAAEDQFEQRERFKTNEGIRSAEATGRYNRPTQWSTDTTKGSDLAKVKTDVLGNDIDPAKSYKTRTLSDGTVEARPTEFTSAKSPKTDNTKLGQLTRRLKVLDPSLSDEAAQQQAAQRMESEEKLTQSQKTGRYNAFIRAAGSTEALKGERLTEAQTIFPVHLAAAKAGIDLTTLRISQADAKNPKEAAKVLQSFTIKAQQIAAKRSLFEKYLGTGDFAAGASAEDIADQLIREAGQDPDELRTTASTAYDKPAKPPGVPTNPYLDPPAAK